MDELHDINKDIPGHLNEQERRISVMLYLGLKQADIAMVENVSQPAISQHLARIRTIWEQN